MRTDSELILTALKVVNDAGEPALPVHDSLIVPARCAGLAEAAMHESFARIVAGSVAGASHCKVKVNHPSDPHMGERPCPVPSGPVLPSGLV